MFFDNSPNTSVYTCMPDPKGHCESVPDQWFSHREGLDASCAESMA